MPPRLVGGRGIHGPAPASASLHRLRRQTVLRGAVNPSSCRHAGGAEWATLPGTLARREAHAIHLPTALSAQAGAETSVPTSAHVPLNVGLGGEGAHSHPPAKAPSACGRPCPVLSGSRGGQRQWPTRGAVEGKVGQSAGPGLRAESVRLFPSSWRERDRWSSAGQSAAEP